MYKVSIIIPVFKERCVSSVLNQTYRELEVILVDDCSPDQSVDLAKLLIEKSEKSKDLEILYLKHKTNRGLSAARNTGIKAAKGDYIYLLDSDDEITPLCIEKLISLALKYPDVDIVQGNTWYNEERFKWLDLSTKNLPEYSHDKQWIRKQFINVDYNLIDNVPTTAWNKLFNRKWFVDNNLWYKEGLIHEDEHWRLMYWKYINSIAFCNDITYKYYIRQDSIITRCKSKDQRYHAFLEIYKEYLPTIGSFSNNEIYKILDNVLKIRRDYNNIADMKSIDKHYKESLLYVVKHSTLNHRIKFALLYLSLPCSMVKGRILKLILR